MRFIGASVQDEMVYAQIIPGDSKERVNKIASQLT